MNTIYTIVLLGKRQGFADRKEFITIMPQKDFVFQAPGGHLHARLHTSPPDSQSGQCKRHHSAAKCQTPFCSDQCGVATCRPPASTTRCYLESPISSNRYIRTFHHWFSCTKQNLEGDEPFTGPTGVWGRRVPHVRSSNAPVTAKYFPALCVCF